MTTVRRIATHLSQLGVTVQVAVVGTSSPLPSASRPPSRAPRPDHFQPDIIHAFHAYKAGVAASELASQLGLPLVVTITGTDVHSDLLSPDRRETVSKVLEAADAIVAFSPAIAEELLTAMPSLSEKVHIVPQGVWFPPQESWDVRKELGIPDNVPLLLLPANIRKVKRPLLAFEGTLLLREKGFDAHLLFVGSVLEDDEWERLERVIRQHEWAHFAGAVPMEKIASVYEAADIVLNTSEHEGGMANSLLEAMALGRPVLAADVTGNRSLVQNGVNGLLFKDASEMAEKAAMLLTDENLRQKLVTAAREWVRQNCDPAEEAKRYLSIYERVSRWVRSAGCNVQ